MTMGMQRKYVLVAAGASLAGFVAGAIPIIMMLGEAKALKRHFWEGPARIYALADVAPWVSMSLIVVAAILLSIIAKPARLGILGCAVYLIEFGFALFPAVVCARHNGLRGMATHGDLFHVLTSVALPYLLIHLGIGVFAFLLVKREVNVSTGRQLQNRSNNHS